MKNDCQIEKHEADGHHREWTVALDESSVEDLMESLRGSWSATLRIPGQRQEMAVSFSLDAAAVMLIAGEDEFYDLLRDDRPEGWQEFVHGGQAANHPRRHCVSIGEAKRWAAEFLRNGSIHVPDQRWERQGEHEP